MRRPFTALLVLLAPVAALAQAPAGQSIASQVPGLSPAGIAALNKLSTQQDPAVPKQVKDEAAIRQQMVGIVSQPNVDLAKLAAVMAQARVVQGNGRKILDDHLLLMLRTVPAVDRPKLLRAAMGAAANAAQGGGGR